MYYLDTNTCIYFMKGMYQSILDAFKAHKPEDIKIPALVKAELLLGVEKSDKKKHNQILYAKFLEPFEIISFDDEAAILYATIRAALENRDGKKWHPRNAQYQGIQSYTRIEN